MVKLYNVYNTCNTHIGYFWRNPVLRIWISPVVLVTLASVASLVTAFVGESGGQVYEETSPAVIQITCIGFEFYILILTDKPGYPVL